MSNFTSKETLLANIPTLEERVNSVYRSLVLIHAASNSDVDGLWVDADALQDAISEAAWRALEMIDPLRHAPGAVANWRPGDAEEKVPDARPRPHLASICVLEVAR